LNTHIVSRKYAKGSYLGCKKAVKSQWGVKRAFQIEFQKTQGSIIRKKRAFQIEFQKTQGSIIRKLEFLFSGQLVMDAVDHDVKTL